MPVTMSSKNENIERKLVVSLPIVDGHQKSASYSIAVSVAHPLAQDSRDGPVHSRASLQRHDVPKNHSY